MLADSVEAASRSLSDPTHKRLETLVDMIFKTRIEDGQLSDTDLTFRDLDLIKETFLSMLLGIYHVRVRYPGQEGEPTRAQRPRRSETKALGAGVDESEGVWGTMDQSVSQEQAPHEAKRLSGDEADPAKDGGEGDNSRTSERENTSGRTKDKSSSTEKESRTEDPKP